jgi:hypothetical protein
MPRIGPGNRDDILAVGIQHELDNLGPVGRRGNANDEQNAKRS